MAETEETSNGLANDRETTADVNETIEETSTKPVDSLDAEKPSDSDASIENEKPIESKSPEASSIQETCPQCGESIDSDADFCGKCGAKLHTEENDNEPKKKACPKCGYENEADMAFCSKCGSNLDAKTPITMNKPNAELTAQGGKKKLIAIVAGIVVIVVVVIAIVLSQTIGSPKAQADKLYEEGSYQQALEKYNTLGDSDEIKEKKSDCRYYMFIDYLKTNGAYTTSESATTWTVEGYTNGDIKCSVSSDTSEKYFSWNAILSITIHHGNPTADLSASSNMKLLTSTIKESGTGEIDLPSYTYGKNITIENYTNSGNTTTSLIKTNDGMIQKMIQKGLNGALTASNTGCTLEDLGFESLTSATSGETTTTA